MSNKIASELIGKIVAERKLAENKPINPIENSSIKKGLSHLTEAFKDINSKTAKQRRSQLFLDEFFSNCCFVS